MRWILILKHKGKKKNYWTVHLMEGDEYLRIYGKFGTKSKALNKAEKISKMYGGLEIVVKR